MVVWLYKPVLVPRVAYASVVWWPKTEHVSVFKKLESLRGLVLRGAGEAKCRARSTIKKWLSENYSRWWVVTSGSNHAKALRSKGKSELGRVHLQQQQAASQVAGTDHHRPRNPEISPSQDDGVFCRGSLKMVWRWE